MEQYPKTLQKRLVGIGVYNAVLIALLVFMLLSPAAGGERMKAFVSGFDTGLFAVAQGVLILSFVKYRAALKDPEKRKAMYIAEHDERMMFIYGKMGGTAMQIVLLGLMAATIAAGYFSQTVFFTLLGTLLFTAGVKAGMKIYYTKKVS